MSPISPSDGSLAMMQLDQQSMIQKRLDMDALRERLSGAPDKKAKLREACEGFESVFIQKMWEQMRKNVEKSGYLHSRDEQMYQGMYDAEFSKKMTQAGGIGLADMLYEQLSQRLGESSRSSSPSVSPRLPILPAGGSLNGLAANVQPLTGEEAKKGIPLAQSSVRPLYEDAPAHVVAEAQVKAAQGELAAYDEAATDLPEKEAAPAEALPASAQRDEAINFEELSQSLLLEEMGEDATAADASLTQPQAALSPEEEAMLEAALRQSMADAGRITSAQAPAPAGRNHAFGTALAEDTARSADSAATTQMNNLPRS